MFLEEAKNDTAQPKIVLVKEISSSAIILHTSSIAILLYKVILLDSLKRDYEEIMTAFSSE